MSFPRHGSLVHVARSSCFVFACNYAKIDVKSLMMDWFFGIYARVILRLIIIVLCSLKCDLGFISSDDGSFTEIAFRISA